MCMFKYMEKGKRISSLKKDDPFLVSNYRPVSLLSTIDKVMVKIVYKYIFNFLNDNQVITCL